MVVVVVEYAFLINIIFIFINRITRLWRAYCLFVARVASFAPERREGVNDATRATNKQYARQKSCYYHYHQCTRPYHEESMAIK